MSQLNILNTREVKKIHQLLLKTFAYTFKEDYAYLKNEKDRIFLVNKDLSRINLNNLKVDRVGIYFAEMKNDQIRLSKEGAQLLVKEAKINHQTVKNLILLEKPEVKKYFAGEDLEKDLGTENCLIILLYADEVLGCAKYKEGKIINFLPKIHRGEVIL